MPKIDCVGSELHHMKEHPSLIDIVKFERDWRIGKAMVGNRSNKRA